MAATYFYATIATAFALSAPDDGAVVLLFVCTAPLAAFTAWRSASVRFFSLEYARSLKSPFAVEQKARYLEHVGAVNSGGRRTVLGGDIAPESAHTSDPMADAGAAHEIARADGVIELHPEVKTAIMHLFEAAEATFEASPLLHLFLAHQRVSGFSSATS